MREATSLDQWPEMRPTGARRRNRSQRATDFTGVIRSRPVPRSTDSMADSGGPATPPGHDDGEGEEDEAKRMAGAMNTLHEACWPATTAGVDSSRGSLGTITPWMTSPGWRSVLPGMSCR